jgi:transposase
MVLLSAQGMDVGQIAKVAFTSPDRVREVLHNFNDDGFDSLVPKYAGGRPPTFTLPERREIKKIALSRPVDHGLPFSTWSLSKLTEFLVAEGVVDDISHEGLRVLLREEGVSFQVIKTWKQSNDPDFEAKKNRVLELYDIQIRRSNPAWPPYGRVLHGRVRAAQPLAPPGQTVGAHGRQGRDRRRPPSPAPPGHLHPQERRPPPYGGLRPHHRQALRAYQDQEGPHDVPRVLPLPAQPLSARHPYRRRAGQLQPPPVDQEGHPGRRLAAENNVELAYVPTNASWMNRIEAQFQALRYFTLDGTDHRSHEEQNSMIRRYIIWRNRNAHDKTLRELVKRANVA